MTSEGTDIATITTITTIAPHPAPYSSLPMTPSYAYVLIDHFPLQVAIATGAVEPELAGRPVVIGGQPHERKPVIDCSAEAAEWGVRPGQPLREAQALCPEAVFRPIGREVLAETFEGLLTALTEFSPAIEPVRLGEIALEVRGLTGLHGAGDALAAKLAAAVSSFEFRIGLGENRFLAEVAAHQAAPGGWRIVAPGTEQEFLAPLSVRFLPGSAEVHRRLRLFGLRRIDQVAAIPAEDLIRQFGPDGRLLAERSRGIDPRPIAPWSPPPELAEQIVFEEPPATRGAFQQTCAVAAERLATDLRRHDRVAQRVTVEIAVEAGHPHPWANAPDPAPLARPFRGPAQGPPGCSLSQRERVRVWGVVNLPRPTAQPDELIRAVNRAIERAFTLKPVRRPESHVPSRGPGDSYLSTRPTPSLRVVECRIRFGAITPDRGVQLALFQRSPAAAARLRRAIDDLEARWGSGVVKRAAIVAPRARLAERRFVWRELR